MQVIEDLFLVINLFSCYYHAVLPHIDEDDEANHLKVKEIVSWIFLVVYH